MDDSIVIFETQQTIPPDTVTEGEPSNSGRIREKEKTEDE